MPGELTGMLDIPHQNVLLLLSVETLTSWAVCVETLIQVDSSLDIWLIPLKELEAQAMVSQSRRW